MAVKELLFILFGCYSLSTCIQTHANNFQLIQTMTKEDIQRHFQGRSNGHSGKIFYNFEYQDPCIPLPHNPCKPKATGKMFGCPRRIFCDPRYIYRTSDGTCNNLHNPLWGASETPFVRLLPHAYEDGISLPRGHLRNPPLPSPRAVSFALSQAARFPNTKKTSLMVMQWGQLTDHDLTLSPDVGESCCDDFKNLNTSNFCYQLDVKEDAFYTQHGVQCMPFLRSLSADEFCRCGEPREQINVITAFVDGSHTYGNNPEEALFLRSCIDGKLKIGPENEGWSCPAVCPLTFLPEKTNRQGKLEFFAGDSRVNEQPGLTSIHTLFVRFHNHIVEKLKVNYPHYDDEQLYQEGRRIVGAVAQQITYGEFLPVILGRKSMIDNGLYPINATVDAYETRYIRSIDPSVFNVFSSAAFRFGHSLVSDVFRLNGTNVNLSESFNLHSRTLINGTYPSNFLKGIAAAGAETMDHYIVEALTNKLTAVSPFRFGRDLFTLNIMRGRDHGIPPYNDWRKLCGLSVMRNFSDLLKVMPEAAANVFAEKYSSVNDIDVFPAAISETSTTDGILGPVLTCIIEKQFFNLKFGDRFWFESLYQPKVFSLDQLRSIHLTKLSTLICKYTDALQIQLEVMRSPDQSNPLISCSEILQRGVISDINIF